MSERVLQELERISTFFPILTSVGVRLAATRPWEGKVMAAHLHLTTLTAALVRELTLGGGKWIISAANPATTDPSVVTYLRNLGLTVYSGRSVEDGIAETLKAEPSWFADVGFALGSTAIRRGYPFEGGVEISRSGITRMRTYKLPFPMINIDGGRLKPAIENRHGVGEGLWQAFTTLTGKHLAGRRVTVIGYGPVGAGVAAYARAGGAHVSVVEISPIRRLIAQYDGYDTPELNEACSRTQVVITATGVPGSLPMSAIKQLPQGAVLINTGHHNNEIPTEQLREEAEAIDEIGPHVVRYRLDGRWRVLLADGNPLNIVLNSGSQEPVLLHFTVLALSLAYLTGNTLKPGELLVPLEIEEEAARLALSARK